MRGSKVNTTLIMITGIFLVFKSVIFGGNIANDIVKETLLQSQQNQKIRVVWWIPEEFWIESFKKNSAISKEQTEQFVSLVHPYTLIVAIDGDVGFMGGVTYSNMKDVRADLELISPSEEKYLPLADSLLSPDLINFLAMMKPVLSNMLGQMGANMNFFIFKGKTVKDLPIMSANSKGSFIVRLQKEEFKYRLPLAALLPKRICPECKEIYSGSYIYCPYDGKKTRVNK